MLFPGQPGALKLSRKYGDALVYVRYRLDADGLHRYTTVELIVDRVPIVKRVDRIVGVCILYEETTIQLAVRASGAAWDKPAKLVACPTTWPSGWACGIGSLKHSQMWQSSSGHFKVAIVRYGYTYAL